MEALFKKRKQQRLEALKKYKGKTIYDKKYKEQFLYSESRDWEVMNNEPERFEVVE